MQRKLNMREADLIWAVSRGCFFEEVTRVGLGCEPGQLRSCWVLGVVGKKSLTWKKMSWHRDWEKTHVARVQRASQNASGVLAGGDLLEGFAFCRFLPSIYKQWGVGYPI